MRNSAEDRKRGRAEEKDRLNLKDLKPAEYNPRKITDAQIERLKKSLTEFGDLSGIVFNRRTGNLVGGHQRLKCLPPDASIEKKEFKKPSSTGTVAEGHIILAPRLDKEGSPRAGVVDEKYSYREVDWPLEKEKAANIAANKHGGEWDDEKLAELLKELTETPDFDIDLTGFESSEIDNILSSIKGSGQIEDDDVPDVNTPEPITKTGDLYILGKHRLLCGDCTNKADIDVLMAGKKADMVFTDPPYGVSYADKNTFLNSVDNGNRIQKKIEHDHVSEDEIKKFWKRSFEIIRDNLATINSYYIFGPQIQGMMMMMMMMQEADLPYRHVIIWVKNNHVLGRCDYNYKHEPIFFGWTKTHKFYGNGEFQTSVWQVDKPLKSDLHPTMKPIRIIENALLNSSLNKQITLDPFLGSGSTLIACEKTNRICYGMEIDPHYCDVIVTRYCKYTGNNRIIRNGQATQWTI